MATPNLFELSAKIKLDTAEYERNLKSAEKQGSNFASKLKSGLGTVAKVGAAGLAAVGTAIIAVTKQAVDAYADYEQLIGGTELMFGEAYDFIVQKSKDAYKTVQMSQNDYLRQVNGFAVGLRTALNGNEKQAAKLADKIITAEADVVAATGNTQEAVQNAFNGIMKSNYTMLDNLQLGIKPTKEGFQELIDKVNDWNRANGRTTKYTIENIADCQAALVDYIEMQGLSGYAANEASKTIQGSIASAKAAYQNWLTSLASADADVEKLTKDLFDSVQTAANNLLPVVKTVFSAIVDTLFSEESISKFVEGAGALIYNLIQGLFGASKDSENQSKAQEIGQNIGRGIRDGIANLLSEYNWFELIWDIIKGSFQLAFGGANTTPAQSGGMGIHGYDMPTKTVSSNKSTSSSSNKEIISAINNAGNQIGNASVTIDGNTVAGYVDTKLGNKATSTKRYAFG